MIKIKVDNTQALAGLQQIKAAQMKMRLTRAVRTTLKEAKTTATAAVNARFTKDFATGKMKVKASGLNGSLSAKDRRRSITRFKVTPKSRPPHNPPGGITAYVRKGEAENLPQAFIGRGQVFERTGQPRLPIFSHKGAGGANELSSSRVKPKVERVIEARLQKELEALL